MRYLIFALLLLIPTLGLSAESASEVLRTVYGSIDACVEDSDVDAAFSTTVAVDALAAQKVIGLTAVTNLAAGDTILIDADNSGPRRELCVVASIATLDVTCVDNLVYAHTAVQADDVVLTNRLGPLTAGARYQVQLVTTADAAQPGGVVAGGANVSIADTTNYSGISLYLTALSSERILKIRSDGLYLSFRTQTGNAISRACKLR